MTPPTTLTDALCRGAHPARWVYRSTSIPCDDCSRAAAALLAPGGWFEGLAQDEAVVRSLAENQGLMEADGFIWNDRLNAIGIILGDLVATLRTTA